MNKNKQSLTEQSFRAVSFVLIIQFIKQFCQIILGILLIRILTPEDYGVLGVLTIFWAISNVFINGGFGKALLQRKEITQLDLSSVFYYNMFLAFVCCFIMIIMAPWLADFFNRPILSQTIIVSAWSLPIAAFSSIQQVLLSRELRQELITFSSLLGIIISGPIALFIAYLGFGVWALVWQSFIMTLCSSLTVCLIQRWIPQFRFSFKSIGSLFKFGINILLSGLLDCIFVNIYKLIIGKIFPITILGYFERAGQYASIWPTSIQQAISTVLFPAFSKLQDDNERLRNAFHRTLTLSVLVIIFPSLLLCTLSRPFIELILVPAWLPIIPFWWLLTFSFLLYPFHSINLQLIIARGRSDLFLKLEIAKKILIVVNILCTVWFDIFYMLTGMILVSIIAAYLNSYYVGKEIHYSFIQQVKDSIPYFILSIIASCIALISYYFIYPHSPWCGLIFPAFFGFISYALLNRWFQTTAYIELSSLLIRRIPKYRHLLRWILIDNKQ